MKTVQLQYPIACQGKQITYLTVRRPTVRDRLAVEHMQANDTQKEVALISNLCELSPEEMGLLDLADYQLLQEVLNDFLS